MSRKLSVTKEFDNIEEAEAWAFSTQDKLETQGKEVVSALAFSSLGDKGDLVFIGEVIATE